MNRKNLVIISCVLVALVSLSAVTYAYYRMGVNGNVKANVGSISLVINNADASANEKFNITLKRSETEEFVIPSDSGYFDLNVNFTGSAGSVATTVTIDRTGLPNNLKFYVDEKHTNEYISKSYIIRKNDTMVKTIRIYWYWADIDDENDSLFIGKTITASISVSATLAQTMYETLLLKDELIDSNVDFGQGSSESNGQGLMMSSSTKNDSYPILYYRGDVNDNNVVFANKCWLIVRTTETGGTKLIYNGEVNKDGSCINYSGVTGEAVNTSYTDVFINGLYYAFNEKSDSPLYVGYMYNDSSTYYTHSANWTSGYDYYGTLDVTGYNNHLSNNTLDQNTGRHVQNLNDSVVKGVIDAWYSNNIDGTADESLLEDAIWCNERSITSTANGLDSYSSTGLLTYSSYTRIYEMDKIVPTLNCTRDVDKFTVERTNGNGDLTHPVGMLTADELIMSGNNASGAKTYLSTPDERYWLLTPNNFGFGCSAVFDIANGGIAGRDVNYTDLGVRPSVSLGLVALVAQGDGSFQNPYVIG